MFIKKGFALIEMLTVMGIMAILFSLSVPQLFRLQDRNNLQNATIKLTSFIRQQQLNAMNNTLSLYGVYLEQSKYTQFSGPKYISTESANIITTFDYPITLTQIDIPSSTLFFASGSGELVGYSSSHHSIVIKDTVYNMQKTILFNSLGVPTIQ